MGHMKIKTFPVIQVKVGELISNNYNPKKGLDGPVTKRQFEDLKMSLAHGYVQSIVVRENEDQHYEIVDGYHRYLALKEMGVEEIPVTNLGKMAREEAIKWTLRVEKIKVPLDEIMTAERLQELSKIFDIKALALELPYTVEEMTDRIKLLEFDFDALQRENTDAMLKSVFKVNVSPEYLQDAP